MEAVEGAAAVVAVGTCAAFGGLPAASPNPTGAVSVMDLVKDKPVINVSGCPPVPMVITGVLAHYLTFGQIPDLDDTIGPRPSSASPSTTAATAGPSTTRGSSPRASTTRGPGRAGASTAWAARAPAPTTPAPPCAGTRARAGLSSPATPVSAAPSPGSGTPAASTSPSRSPRPARAAPCWPRACRGHHRRRRGGPGPQAGEGRGGRSPTGHR
jgi:hypothetical protein